MRKKKSRAVQETTTEEATAVQRFLIRCNRQNHYITYDGKHLRTLNHVDIDGDEATLAEIGNVNSCPCLAALWGVRVRGGANPFSAKWQRAFDASKRGWYRIPRKLAVFQHEELRPKAVKRAGQRFPASSWENRLDLTMLKRWLNRIFEVADKALSLCQFVGCRRSSWPRILQLNLANWNDNSSKPYRLEDVVQYGSPVYILWLNPRWLVNAINGHHIWTEWVLVDEGGVKRRHKKKAFVLEVKAVAPDKWEVTVLRQVPGVSAARPKMLIETFVTTSLKGMQRVKTS